MDKRTLKILLIEDNIADAGLIREMLSEVGGRYIVTSADRLSSGVKLLEEETFDIVLLDLGLPDSSGIDTFLKLQAQASDLPVIALTGYADEGLAGRAISLGAQDYLVKGRIEAGLLERSIRYAIERKRSEVQLRRMNRKTELILETAGEGIMGLDSGGAITFINNAAAGMLGFTADEMIGKNCLVMFHHSTPGGAPYPAEKCPIDAAFRQGSDRHGEETFWRKDGTSFPVDFTSRPLYEQNKIAGAVVTFRDITERKQAEEALRESEVRLHRIASTALDAVILIDNSGDVAYWNDAATKMFGYASGEILGKYLHSFIMPERHIGSFKKGFEAFQTTGDGPFIGKIYEIEAKRKDGREFPVELSLSAFKLKDKWSAVGIVRDITGRKQLERSLKRSYELTKTIIDSMSEAISLIDVRDFRIVAVNSSFLREYGYSDESEVAGKRCYEVTHLRNAVCSPPDDLCPLDQTVKTGEHFSVEHVHYSKGGEKLYVEISTSPIKDENGTVVQVVHVQRNITERKRMEEEISHMAHHDPLTGLPNRRLFMDIAEVERAQANRHRKKMAVLFLDLDRFKEVNDTLGHAAGDLLLKEAASRLRAVVRKSDTVARIGGDEFNIILADIVHPEDVAVIAAKIVEAFRKPFLIMGHHLHATMSLGIGIYPDDSDEIDALLKYADIAMYNAKENGRNKYRFYNASINMRSLERMRLEGMLQRSLELGEMVLYYQPLVDIRTRRVICAEALVRWRHPEKGLLYPKDFIPVAEETGFISVLDEWALKTVCSQVRSWLDAGNPPVCVTVNLSARQFQNPDLVKNISSILKETGMPPDCLDLEITETIAMTDVERTAVRLKELSKMGIRISIDDFGTGYSSLNYLKKLPVERLKIDRSFIQEVATDPDDRSIVQAVTAMAHSMKMKVVAEGVETEEQFDFLRKTGCDEMQGFLYSKALPADKFRELLTAKG